MKGTRAQGLRMRPRIDLASLARCTVVVIAAGAALRGLLAETPVFAVAWRASVVALIGLTAIGVVERFANRRRRPSTRAAREGPR